MSAGFATRALLLGLGLACALDLGACGGDDDDSTGSGGDSGRGGSRGGSSPRGGAGPRGGGSPSGAGGSTEGGYSGESGASGANAGGASGQAGSDGGVGNGGEGGRQQDVCPEPARTLTATWTGLSVIPAPPARAFSALVATPSSREFILFGGATLLFGGVSDTWTYDGNGWTKRTVDGPGLRAGHAMVGVASTSGGSDAAFLFGGTGSDTTGDSWMWRDGGWTEVCDGASACEGPPPRVAHAMVYDPTRQVVVLFGGSDGDRPLNDTWQWDSERWTELCTEDCSPPSARFDHALAYDSARQRIVLYGGTDGVNELDDLWSFDGERWTRDVVVGPGPGGRAGHMLGYDAVQNLTVLYGGVHGGEVTSDVWAYATDGEAWVRGVASPEPPPARAYAAATWDEASGSFLVFGGGPGGELGDLWSLSLSTPAEATTPCACANECRRLCPFVSQATCLSICDQGLGPETACVPLGTGGEGGHGGEGGAGAGN